jgi:NitT/TauT family transport system substrate-binding protein
VTTKGLLAVLAAAVMALAACGGDDDGGGGGGGGGGDSGGGVTRVKVGTLPIANAAPMYIGMEKGFFREEGIEIEPLVAQSGNELITALVGGDNDFVFLGYTTVIIARSRNLPVKAVVNADNAASTPEDEWQYVMSKKGSSIREPRDLAGKTVGINALKGVAEVGLKAALEKKGVDPGSVKLLEVPFPESAAALDRGRVDAVWAPEPFLTQILEAGGNEVLAPILELGKEFVNGTYATSEQYIAENGDVVERFARAMNKSTQYAMDNPEEARASIPQFTQIPPEIAEKMRLPVWKTEIDRQQLQELVGYTRKYGVIGAEVDVNEMIWEGAEG